MPTQEPIDFQIIRPLAPDEVKNSRGAATVNQPIKRLRYAHHLIAQELIQGKELTLVALSTGYTVAYISNLGNDPAFAELLAYYAAQKDIKFIDVLERMKSVGLSALEELQERLAEKPEDFSNAALLDVVETLVVKPRAPTGGSGANSGAGVAITVNFVGTTQAASAEPPVLEGEIAPDGE